MHPLPHTTIASLERGDIDAVADVFARCFGPSFAHQRRRLEHLDPECVRVLRDCDRVLGSAIVRVRTISFGGALIPTACIASVAVEADARGRGLGGALVADAVARARAAEAPLAVLHAMRTELYERHGFARVGSRWLCTFPPRALLVHEDARRGVEQRVRVAVGSDADAIESLHAENARSHAGHVVLDAHEHAARRRSPRATFVYAGESGVDGYVVLGRRDLGAGRDAVLVHEFVARGAHSAATLCAHVRDVARSASVVRWHLAPFEAHAELLDASHARFEELSPWMLCVVDPERAMLARGFPVDVRDTVTLAVLGAENGRTMRVSVASGRAAVDRSDDVPVRSTAPAFAQLFSGFATASSLAARGAMQGDSQALARLDRMFRGRPPSLQDLV